LHVEFSVISDLGVEKANYTAYSYPVIFVAISTGELLDKLSILEIKNIELDDPEQKKNVSKEFEVLSRAAAPFLAKTDIANLYSYLREVNRSIWTQMSFIFENRGIPKSEIYLDAVEQSISLNIERSEIKRSINDLTLSELIEEKSYFKRNIHP
jgi:hypothetical protein